MPAIDKLLKYLNAKNVADELSDEERDQIAKDVILGYDIDYDSRSVWLENNREAMKIIKHCEDPDTSEEKDFPFEGAAQVVYPLLQPAVIQMAARLATQIVQNDKVVYFNVLGPDPDGRKQAKATRLTDFASYTFLVEDDNWLKDTHKLCSIIASWGTGFRQVYYDPISKRPCNELIPPEDVIINHNLSSLDKAKRITVQCYLTKNNVVEYINAGKFLDEDLSFLDTETEDLETGGDSREINKGHLFLCQTLYIDLDGDEYAEPYKAYVHKNSGKLFGLYPAFTLKDIDIEPDTGKILRIKPKIDIVDYHLIDDPEGKFYSIGLNYLLTHQNKSITALLRQLIDSGTLSNTQGGFVTKAFKTQERTLEFKMGEFQVLECDPTINPQQHIMPLPFKEPSQVLLALLQTLIQAGKETGMITDVLTGDIESQNTPATTMLAMVEQGTRAFKPIIQKWRSSSKKEFKLWYDIQSEYLETDQMGVRYASFQGQPIEIYKEDFKGSDIDVCPVADPTMSSEAHKYAKLKMLVDLMNTPVLPALNVQAALTTIFEGMDFENAQQLIAPPQPPQPDPKVQLDAQKAQMKHQIDSLKIQLQQEKMKNEQIKIQLKANEVRIKAEESDEKQQLMKAQAAQGYAQAVISKKMADIAEEKLDVEKRKVDIMAQQRRDTGNS